MTALSRFLSQVLVAMVALLFSVGCGSSDETHPTPVVQLVSIAVSPADPSVAVGKTQQFTVQGTYSDQTTSEITKNVTWASSDATVATISSAGLATGVKAGTATITASVPGAADGGSVTGTTSLTVTSGANVVTVQVTPAAASVPIGTSQVFKATAFYADGTSGDVSSTATWASDKTAVATIDATGKATAVAEGTANISATFQTKSGTAVMTVPAITVTSIEVTPADVSIPKGTTQQFKAVATFSDTTTRDVSTDATWTSSQTGTATIDATGLASGVAAGTTTISAALNGITGSTSLSVTGAELKTIQVTLTNPPALPVGATFQFHATGTYSDQTTADLTELVTWQSSAASVATVSAKGLATGVAGGTANITAVLGGVTSNTVVLTVQTGVTLSYITVAPASVILVPGQAQQFLAIGHYSDSSVFNLTSSATWAAVQASTDTAVTNFTVSAGLVTGVASTAALTGAKGRVKASQGSVVAYSDVVVKDATITAIAVDCGPSEGLSCIPSGIHYPIQCVATATFSDGTTGDVTGSATWSAKDTTVAVAGSIPGSFTVVGAGSSALVASQGGKDSPSTGDSNAVVTGIAASVTRVDVTPPTAQIAKGAQQQFGATAQFSSTVTGCSTFGLDVTGLAAWFTSDASVATISNAAATRGLAEGHATGTVQIQTWFSGLIGTGSLTVQSACLDRVAIEQVDPTYPGGVLVPLTVRGTYSDKTTARLSPGEGFAWGVAGGFPAIDANWNLNTSVLPAGPTTVTFVATSGTCKAVATDTSDVSVNSAATLTGLSIQPSASQIPASGVADFVANATFTGFTDSYNVSAKAVWSNTPAIAGLANGLRSDALAQRFQAGTTTGGTTVTAVYGTRTATASLVISGSTIKSVAITDIAVGSEHGLVGQTFPVGLGLTFSATVTFSDGTTQVNPSGLSFSSDAPNKLGFVSSGNLARTYDATDPDPNVKATYQGVASPAVAVHIGSGALVGLSFAPNPVAIPVNSSMALAITGNWGGTVEHHFDLSNVVSCSSGNGALVAVGTTATGTRVRSFGTATGATPVPVTCLFGTTTGAVNVTVNASCIATIAVSPATPTLPKGTTQDFVATATYTDGTVANVTNAGAWTTTDATVLASLPQAGRFNAKAAGSVTLGFSLSSDELAVCAGGDTAKTTVTGSAHVGVSAAEIASVVIQPSPVTGAERNVPLGETVQLLAIAILTDGTTVDVTDDPATAWSTQAPEHATVSATGALTATGVGQTVVEVVTANGKTADLLVRIQDCGSPIVSISTNDQGEGQLTTGSLPIGSTRDYTASAIYAFSSTCDMDYTERSFRVTGLAQWVSSKPAAATIASGGSHPGRATGIGAGTASITAVYRGATSNAIDLTVVAVTLKALQIPASNIQTFVGSGSAVYVNVVATYTDGTSDFTLAAPPITWLVIDPTVIAIDADNELTGLKIGSTTFRAQSGAIVSDPVTANVSAACITGVNIVAPKNGVVMPAGVPGRVSARCTTSDGSTLPCNPTFATSDGSVINDYTGHLRDNGMFRVSPAVTSGSATLTATVTTCTGTDDDTITVNVGTATLAAIGLTPSVSSTPRGTKRTFTATGLYSGGTGAGGWDLTPLAVYASSNLTVATPDNDGTGRVTAKAVDGNTLITASYGGVVSNAANLIVSGKTLTSLGITADPNCTVTPVGADAAYPGGGFALPLHVTGNYSDGSSAPLNGAATWSLVAPIVAGTSIDSATGVLVTGAPTNPSEQTQRVSASVGAITKTFDVAIVNSVVASIAIAGPTAVPNGVTVAFGASATLVGTATSCPSDVYAADRNVAWASSDPTKGSIVSAGGGAGFFTGAALGTTNVTVSRGTATGGPVVVTVTDAVKQSVSCQPGTVVVGVSDTAKLRAVVTYSDATQLDEVLTQADWNNSIASGASNVTFGSSELGGVLSALSSGTARVSPVVLGPADSAIPVTQACSITVN